MRPGLSEPSVPIRKQRILVADDENYFRQFSSLVLPVGGIEVNVASDSEQAWHALSTSTMKPNVHDRLRWNKGAILATFDTAGEWSSLFQHEAMFPSASLLATAPQPSASKEVHNRILIADDDALVRGSLAAVLESEGFAVDEAQNGIEAVTRVVAHTPDLVLLDLNMPHWDGWTAFSKLDRVTPLLPVIVITARPNQYQKAVQLGVDAFMEKPLNIPILVRAIKHLSSEDKNCHVHRITNRAFVTQLLGGTGS